MPAYTFIASNALTNKVIDEIPLVQVTYARALNGHGDLKGTVALDDAGVRTQQLIDNGALEPGAVAIYVVRDKAFVWGGLLWEHAWKANAGTLSITASEFDSYMAMRYVMQERVWTGDRATLAANWITNAFADGGPPLTSMVSTTGIADTVQTHSYEQHCVLDLVRTFATLQYGQGIDYEFDIVSDTNGNPSARLTISAPRRGVSFVNTGIVFDYPGQVTDYSVVRSAQQYFCTDLVVTGAGSGPTQLQSEAQQTSAPYVKLTSVENNRSLTTPSAVSTYASGKLLSVGRVPNLYTANINAADFFAAGITVGDELILAVNDPYQSANVAQRLIGYTVNVGDETKPETVDLVLGAVL